MDWEQKRSSPVAELGEAPSTPKGSNDQGRTTVTENTLEVPANQSAANHAHVADGESSLMDLFWYLLGESGYEEW